MASASFNTTDAFSALQELVVKAKPTAAELARIKPHLAYIKTLMAQPSSSSLATSPEDDITAQNGVQIVLSMMEILGTLLPDFPEESRVATLMKMVCPSLGGTPALTEAMTEKLRVEKERWKRDMAEKGIQSVLGHDIEKKAEGGPVEEGNGKEDSADV